MVETERVHELRVDPVAMVLEIFRHVSRRDRGNWRDRSRATPRENAAVGVVGQSGLPVESGCDRED